MNAILLVATVQAWFFAGLILRFKKPKELSDYILSVWLFLIGLHTILYFLMASLNFHSINILVINAGFPFLQGPLLFFYVRAKTQTINRIRFKSLVHLLPFVCFVSYQFVNYYSPANHDDAVITHRFVGFFDDMNPIGLFFLVSLLIYLLASIFNTRSAPSPQTTHITWVRLLILFVGMIWLSALISLLLPTLFDHQDQVKFNYLIFISLTGFIYLVSYLGFKEGLFSTDIPVLQVEKYGKSKVSDAEAEAIWSVLVVYMKSDEPYLKPELTLTQLAEMIDVSSNKLSQVINTKVGRNFYDFVNQYRVEKAKNLIRDGNHQHFSILGIAYEAGFPSKATFNRAFKKLEGKTPTQFKEAS